jgi:peptide subunit release factor 1 (eRF1)
MNEVLDRLARMTPGKTPVLSVYLDMRPQATGQRPSVRSGLVVLKDRLREIEKTLGPRGPALDAFRADKERIEQYDASPAAQGVALFASDPDNLFEVVEAGVPFQNEVTYTDLPELFQLAHLRDEHETSVVAVVDTNTARLFIMRRGFLEEQRGLSERPRMYSMRYTGGLNIARYQRRIKNSRESFAKEAAAEIERLVDEEGATRVVLAGDAVAIPLLRAALSPRVTQLLHNDVLRLDIRDPRTEIEREVAPVLAQAEAENERAVADQLMDAVQANGLGVVGLEETQAALDHGQVDVLLLMPQSGVDEGVRQDLVRRAIATSAEVEMVKQHELLEMLGGVGALLRYRHEGYDATAAGA